MRQTIMIAFILAFFTLGGFSQQTLQIAPAKSKLSILGSSTLHDWEIEVNDFSGSIIEEGGEIMEGRLSARVKSFKSFKRAMDKVVFEALKEKEHPELIFTYEKTVKTFSKSGKEFRELQGDLTIAGTTKTVTITLRVSKHASEVVLTGQKTFNMSDFNIKPPTAVFGTIKSGDKITIDFNIHFS
jgi:polyisoprenoid-binding protein YceI